MVAFCLLTLLFAANIVHEVLADRLQIGAIMFHCSPQCFSPLRSL